MDDGYLLTESPATQCADNIPDQLEAGVFLTDIATQQNVTLAASSDYVEAVALDYPFAAWATIEDIGAGLERLTIWAMDVEIHSQPIEIESDDIDVGGQVYLFVEDDMLYWITTYGSDGVGNAARAPIAGDTTYFKSMHDTGEVCRMPAIFW